MLFAAAVLSCLVLCVGSAFLPLQIIIQRQQKTKNNTKRTLSGRKQPARKRKTIGRDNVALVTFIHLLFLLPEALTLA